MNLASGTTSTTMNAEALTWSGVAVMVALAIPSVLALMMDERELLGVNVWVKPLKFELSFALHMATVALVLRLLPGALLDRSTFRATVLVGVLSSVLETLYIALQSARGRESHFNVQTPLESALYYAGMGTGAVAIVVSSFIVGWQVWRHGVSHTPSGLRTGAALGLMLGSLLTLIVASVLSSGAVAGAGHWVGGVHSDATGLALVGWSTTGGDLRVPHFFATHLMQALPLAGWLADRLDPMRATGWVQFSAIVMLSIVIGTFWQAVTGHALLPL